MGAMGRLILYNRTAAGRSFTNAAGFATMVSFAGETMKLHPVIAALAFAAMSSGAYAQTIKTGLWEFTTQMAGGGGKMSDAMAQAQKEMASMPPEQRKMMQDMMAKQGVQMGTGAGGGMTVKVCMTQEMVDRNDVSSHQDGCTHTNSPRMGSTMKFSFVCTKPPSSGEGQVTFTSPEAYSMKMTTTTTVQGRPEKMEMQNSGRWLGSNCGSVKPLAMPKT
jgi:hypothetical protein